MISSNDFCPGVTIEYRGGVWQIQEAMHVKPGKGAAFVRTRLKNLETDDVLRVTFRAGERVQEANIERFAMIYFYKQADQFIMMDATGSQSLELGARHFGQSLDLLKEGLEGITVVRHCGRIISVELPNTVDVEVLSTPPDERGDTNSGGGKQAVLESGAQITVPFHVKTGDKIRVDTRTREYLGRVSNSESP